MERALLAVRYFLGSALVGGVGFVVAYWLAIVTAPSFGALWFAAALACTLGWAFCWYSASVFALNRFPLDSPERMVADRAWRVAWAIGVALAATREANIW